MRTLITALSLLLLVGCDPEPRRLTEYKPVLINRADLDKSIQLSSVRPIQEPGKIYRYQDLLFINEMYEGVHVYDNSDPTDPVALGFIKILGNKDIAVRDGIIYADNATDLVALQYNVEDLTVISRSADVFPEVTPPDFGTVPEEYLPENRPANTVIIKWEKL